MSEAIQISVFPAPDSSRYGMAFCRSAGISAPPSVVLLTVRSARASGAGIWVTVPVAESSRERRQWPSCAKVDSTRGGWHPEGSWFCPDGHPWRRNDPEPAGLHSIRSFPSRRSFRAGGPRKGRYQCRHGHHAQRQNQIVQQFFFVPRVSLAARRRNSMAAQGTERCRHRLTRWMMMGTEAAKRAL